MKRVGLLVWQTAIDGVVSFDPKTVFVFLSLWVVEYIGRSRYAQVI